MMRMGLGAGLVSGFLLLLLLDDCSNLAMEAGGGAMLTNGEGNGDDIGAE